MKTFLLSLFLLFPFFAFPQSEELGAELKQLIRGKQATVGVAVILVSSELPEVLGMSDRIMVVHEGKVTGIISGADADQEKVMTLATGGCLA